MIAERIFENQQILAMQAIVLAEIKSGDIRKAFTELFYETSMSQGILALCDTTTISDELEPFINSWLKDINENLTIKWGELKQTVNLQIKHKEKSIVAIDLIQKNIRKYALSDSVKSIKKSNTSEAIGRMQKMIEIGESQIARLEEEIIETNRKKEEVCSDFDKLPFYKKLGNKHHNDRRKALHGLNEEIKVKLAGVRQYQSRVEEGRDIIVSQSVYSETNFIEEGVIDIQDKLCHIFDGWGYTDTSRNYG